MIRLFLFSLTLFLTSCASIPLSTMLEFRNFGKDDFINIQPQELATNIQIDDPARAKIDTAQLSLDLQTAQGTRAFQFPLILSEEIRIEAVSGFFSNTPAKTEYRMRLSAEAIQNFKKTQQIFRDEQLEGFNFAVSTSVDELPADVTAIHISIFLKLSQEQGFVTLFDNVKLEVKREG